MCGRYTLSKPQQLIDELEEALGEDFLVEAACDQQPRYNIAPTQEVPIVKKAESGALWKTVRWGLDHPRRPQEGSKRPPLLINARVETVAQLPAFKESIAKRRCLVPADGFYEWSARSAGHQPHLLFLPASDESTRERRGFCLAGIWRDSWIQSRPGGRSVSGDSKPTRVPTFSILTTDANDSVRPLHDRMPIVLPRPLWRHWLEPEHGAEEALRLLAEDDVARAARWLSHPVSERVNKPIHDDARLIEAVPVAATNLSLF